MRFSSRLPIATHILLCLGVLGDECKFTSSVLAGSIGVNPVVVRNILGMLKAAGLVRVEQGVGGATLARDAADITLLDVLHAVEDDSPLFHMHENPNVACPVGRNVQAVLGSRLDGAASAMEAELASVTLADLADDTRALMAEQEG